MGTILTSYGDAACDHEGYPAQVLDDGTLTGTHGPETRPRMVGQVVAACSCGWTGTTRYPSRREGDEAALAEWEHTHARPILERDQLIQWDRLRTVLRLLGTEQHALLTAGSIQTLRAADRVDVLERTLRVLDEASKLARELRNHLTSGGAGS